MKMINNPDWKESNKNKWLGDVNSFKIFHKIYLISLILLAIPYN